MRNLSYAVSLFIITLFYCMPVFAQSPGIEWQQPVGGPLADNWVKTLVTSDNNLLVAGRTARSGRGNDLLVRKMGQDGKLIWEKVLGGSADESLVDVFPAADGGFVLAATTLSGDGDVVGFHGPSSNPDAWIVKLSASGAVEWQRSIGGTGVESFVSGALLPDGSFTAVGRTNSGNGDFVGGDGSDRIYVARFNSTGTLLWKTLAGGALSAVKKAIFKANGNVLIGGDYNGAGNHGMVDVFLTEVSNTGAILSWRAYGGSAPETFSDLVQTGTGKYTVLSTTGSSNGDVTGTHGASDIWVFTVGDGSTNILWQKNIGGTQTDQNPTMSFNATDSSMIISVFTMSNDGDMPGNHGGIDIWAGKLSNAGSLLWGKCLGGSGADIAKQVQVNTAGEVFLLAQTASNDGNVSGYHGGNDLWFVKMGADGAIAWQKCLGGSLNENPFSFLVETDGITILAASPSKDGDVQGMHYRSDTTTFISYNDDIWLTNLSNSGSLNWQKPLGGYGVEAPGNVIRLNGKYFVSGMTNSNNGDVSGLLGGYDIWVVKLGPSNVIKGSVFFDLNRNGIKDLTESFYDNVLVKSEKNGYLRWSIPYKGQFKNETDTGSFTTAVTLLNPYFTVVPVSRSSSFTQYFSVDSVDFALQPIPGKRDVAVNVIPVGAARPGFNSAYRIYYRNMGTDTVASGKVYMLKDSHTVFVQSVPAPDLVKGDTLTWNYSNLQPAQEASIAIQLSIAAPPAVNVGDILVHKAFIDTLAIDQAPANNRDTLRQLVRGAIDPNDKSENHAGNITRSAVTGGDYLTYVINFQNLGTDTAFNIVVRDTLDAKLNWNTLQMIGASHGWSLQISDGNKCTWTFNNILLPHSAINEPASHGYIAYRIKPLSTLTTGNTVNNSASIYFDYNLPVVTNTAVTTVLPDPVAQPVISGLANNYCSSQSAPSVKILNLPDNNTTKVVKLDNTVLSVAADSTFTFALSALAAGNHTITVTYSNTADSKTTTANFTIMAALTPDVNVTANSTQVVNLTNPVIITAANAAGGGKNPLYTFAWNRDFTNIIQAESSSNTTTIAASAFAMGNNLVYVRMKTSETCYTALLNTDSITIRRDQATGITDVDNPGQVIDVYPNPFRGAITIQGLNPGRTYAINVYNLHGQLLHSQQASNRSTVTIPGSTYRAGTYWISIYDQKKKKLLGTVPLIRE